MECKLAAARIAAARDVTPPRADWQARSPDHHERQWLLARLNKLSVKGATIDVTPIARVT